MAAPVVASTSTTTNFDNDDLTLTPPSGITDGDLLVIVATTINAAPTVTPPTGFTLLTSETGTQFGIFAWYKVASSESGNYVIDTGGGSLAGGAAMFRITGAATSVFNTDKTEVTTVESSGAKSKSSTVKKQSDSLIINANVTGVENWSSSAYTITHGGSNPTWTEVLDAQDGGVDQGATAVAYATTTDTSDITAWGFTSSGAGTSTWGALLIVILSPKASSGTSTTLAVSPTFYTGTATSGSSGTSTTLAITPTLNTGVAKSTTPTAWTNETRPSTNWTNET